MGKMTITLDPQEKNMNLGKRSGCPYRQFRVEGTAVNYFQMFGFARNRQTKDGDSCALWVSPSPKIRQKAKENSSDHDMERSGLGKKLEGWDYSNYGRLARNAAFVQNGLHQNGMLRKKRYAERWYKFRKANRFSHSMQLCCGMHGVQLPAVLDVIRKEQKVT